MARENLCLHIPSDALGQRMAWRRRHTAPACSRAVGAASGHSQSPEDGGMGEMSSGEGGEWLAGGSHSKMSWSKVPLEPVWV